MIVTVKGWNGLVGSKALYYQASYGNQTSANNMAIMLESIGWQVCILIEA